MEIIQDKNNPTSDNGLDTSAFNERQEQHPANPEPIHQGENNTAKSSSSKADTCKKGLCHTCLTVFNVILLIGLVVLYILHFTGYGTPSKHNSAATKPLIHEDGQLRVACVDSDSLLAKYQYAIDLQDELIRYKESIENDYRNKMTQFQKDYNNFLQTGENMTLSQQQAKEEELKQRAEKLSTLEAELTQKVLQKQMDSNIELLNRIFAFVREYNADNQQFDIILRKTFNDSPTLYMNPAMDITNEIIDGLNEEYKSVKSKKK